MPGRLGAARHREVTVEVAVAGRRVDPQPQADVVGAVVGQDPLGRRGPPAVGVDGAGLWPPARRRTGRGRRSPAGVAHRARLADARALDRSTRTRRAIARPLSHAGVPTGTVALTRPPQRPARTSPSRSARSRRASRRSRRARAGGRGRSSACPRSPVGHHVVAALPSAALAGRGGPAADVVALRRAAQREVHRQSERQAMRPHRPPPRARRSRRSRWTRWGTGSSSSA